MRQIIGLRSLGQGGRSDPCGLSRQVRCTASGRELRYSTAMPSNTSRLTSIVEDYFKDLRRVRASGGATAERSTYSALANLFDSVGATLSPKVFCVQEIADQGAGHPDFGLYAAGQVQKGRPRKGQIPERGVVEVKAPDDDASLTAEGSQVSGYWEKYRLVLVTNTREFVLLGENGQGAAEELETYRLADSPEAFEELLARPRASARKFGAGLGEYLCRALSHRATLSDPGDLAWLLASYARDGLARVESAADPSALSTLRSALEDALGVQFRGARGEAFFRSTLVQTLFYGIFSAWVLWSREPQIPAARFDWRLAVWHLRAPVLRALFQQLSNPGQLGPLGLIEVLDWTATALDRVDRKTFFQKFDQGEAVQYFYEPFLQAFDPELRKQLGVWYTPSEVVRYMVARVDMALKEDLQIENGLAAENVYVLDPCCGTGAYVSEVLRRIAQNLQERGVGALVGSRVKQAATERVFGFEIMPAPFVVAHLQVGLTMQDLNAPLSEDGSERAGIFLTNALTGWEPTVQKPLPFPELEEERDRADRVKQDTPVLVILGNPPYNGYAGMAVDEERELSTAYRKTRLVRKPEGQGLNDLYVRFFRMAERRITEKTGQGVVCFISNYSWLDGLSFTGMRERFMREFDAIRIDSLHGDRIISEYAPDGRTSETVFALRGQSPGIRVGTSIAMFSKSPTSSSVDKRVLYRDFDQARAEARRKALLDSLEDPEIDLGYAVLEPNLELGLPFKPMAVSNDWHDWPALPELFPVRFHGVLTNRDAFLVDIDPSPLKARIADYFIPALSHEEIGRRYPRAMRRTAEFDARSARNTLLRRGGPNDSDFVRFTYRPFDNRWLYWEGDTKLVERTRADYRPHVFEGNLWMSAAQHLRQGEMEPQAVFTKIPGSHHLIERGSNMFPAYLRDDGLGIEGDRIQRRPNLSGAAVHYLERIGADVEDLFHHVLAVLHDPAYRDANAGALRMEWPRIPIPGWPAGDVVGAAEELTESAERGRELAALLDSDTPVPGVTTGSLRPLVSEIAVPSTSDDSNMDGDDFNVTAGWGHYGSGQAVMPGQGHVAGRPLSDSEQVALGDNVSVLGDTSYDVYLNDRAYWRNVPASVWNYRLGGYQVLKKWLSYRESKVLGRALLPDEVQHFTDTARRIGAILELVNRSP